MKKSFYYLFFLGCLIAVSSCKDIIEPSIKDRKVMPEAPGDQYQSNSYTVNFWWDNVEDALKYHLQIVTPDFNKIGSLIIDTLVKNNKFTMSLRPGTYQWRVRAENGSSQTAYSVARSFVIIPSSLNQQTPQLTAPANNLLTNQSSISMQWSALYGADKYQLEIDTNSFADENALIYNQTIPAQQYTFVMNKDKTYQWRVRAQNDTAKSQWSTINTFSYDHTPPVQVALASPANGDIISLPATLQWNNVATAVKYKLYVFKTDSTTVYNTSFPMVLNTNSYTLSSGVSGERVYWKVSAIDAAGNEGTASVQRSFVWR
ncbi:MAG TPA: hypothetical protein VL442_03140 [Mucilaginibacter sp.]|jgi:hypothetical protein|nr:hypothetical protein [Mucilaginibacter sp.]